MVRAARCLAVLVLLAVGLVTPLAAPAYAGPHAGPPHAGPSLGDVEKQIDEANNKLEQNIEDYNRVHSQLLADQTKAAALTKSLGPLEAQAKAETARLLPLITQAYEAGPPRAITLLLSSDSTASMLNDLTVFDTITKTKQARINAVVDAHDRYLAAKQSLDATLATLRQQNADLAAKTTSIQAQIANLQKLRLAVYGNNGPPIGSLRPVPCPFTFITGDASLVARTACSQIGKPYVWAAAGPSTFDCSGLTLYAWAKAGVTLRHYTVWQWDDTTPISRSQLRPGDLVFFYPPSLHHVGLYVGGGWMVHAPHTGDVVRMARIDNYPIAGYRRPS